MDNFENPLSLIKSANFLFSFYNVYKEKMLRNELEDEYEKANDEYSSKQYN